MNKSIFPRPGESLLDLGKRCNAVYICPKAGSVRNGPLVVYAGKDSKEQNLVGDIYFNFRKIEAHLRVVEAFAVAVYNKLREQGLIDKFDTVVGIPHGGRTFGQALARIAGKRFTYADKMPKSTVAGRKQEYYWDLSQFDFEQGERVAVVEDIFNNFCNTDNILSEIACTGASVVLLVGAFNRSPIYDKIYTPKNGLFMGEDLPIVASVCEAYPEYEQDDPFVAVDVAAGNVEWKVKKNWKKLCTIMEMEQ